jgi:molybdopterin converting factor small subunit
VVRVVAPTECSAITGGPVEFDVAADTIRRVILELDGRYPGLGDYIDQRMAFAIDGVIHQDAWTTRLAPDQEIVLIPRIGGG